MNYLERVLHKMIKSGLCLLKTALPFNRVRAVFLCLILASSFMLSSFVPWYSAQALAASKIPGALDVKNQKGKDSVLGISGGALDSNQKQFSPRVNEPKKGDFTAKELVDKRDRFTEVQQNNDGSLTEKNYFASKFYQKDGSWQPINTSLIEDTNAADATGLGKVLGLVESAFKGVTSYKITANDWQARLSSSNDKIGMVRVQFGKDTLVYAPIDAKDVDPVLTTNKDGLQTVHYYDIWPGVNLEYNVHPDSLKLNIVLKDNHAANNIAFRLSGANIIPDKDNKGGYKVEGALGNQFSIAPINLILNNYGLVSQTSEFTQEYKDGVLRTWVNKDYLASLPSNAFPAVIDPATFHSTFGTRVSGNYISFKSDGYICNYTICNVYSGSLLDSSNIWRAWRGALSVPYANLAGVDLTNANLHLTQLTNVGYWTGNYAAHQFAAYWAPCLNNFGCIAAPTSPGYYSIGTSGDINVTEIYRQKLAAGDYGAWLMIVGEECGCDTFKNFDPDNSFVDFTYTSRPVMASAVLPADKQIITTDQPTLQINPVGSSTGDQVKYYYRLSTNPDAETGTVINSGDVTDTQWTVPEGMLQDGMTYYWHAYTSNWINGQLRSYTSPNWVRSFKVNLRTGQDSTQTYDSAGPISVGMATGNTTTSASTHSMRALGGSIGVGLDYNTPKKSKPGLLGTYYNNTNLSGTPVLSRIDQNVNFEWGSASPSANVVTPDNFSAQWNGYFIVPATDTYTFGGINDDYNTVRITVNGVEQVAYSGTCYSTVVCYGTPTFALNAGDVIPIKIDYVEIGGAATVKDYIKGLSTPEQIIPNDWLRTPLRSTSQTAGLKAYYYSDNGSHVAPADRSLAFASRTEPFMNLSWGSGAAVANGPVDNWLATYDGYITAPTTGVYQFETVADDAARVTINGQVVINDYAADGAVSTTWSGNVSLTAGQSVPIKIEYFELGGGATLYFKVKSATMIEQDVPANWLSNKVSVLPDGWNLSLDADGSLAYEYAKIEPSSIVLTDPNGVTSEFKWDGSKNSYASPPNNHDLLVRNSDGSISITSQSGMIYIFNSDGTLREVSTPSNAKSPTALRYTYSGTPARLTQITDPVDPTRFGTLYYSGDTNCPTPPTGFDQTPPANMLCAFRTTDGDQTSLYYKKGQLARLELPGGSLTDIGYDDLGRITQERGNLANDAISAGVIPNDANATTEVAYDLVGRVSTVTEPAPSVGAARRVHTYSYKLADTGYWTQPEPLGPNPEGNPVASTWGDDRINLFTRFGTNASYRYYDGTSWSDWQDLGSSILNDPGATSMNKDRIDMYVRGADNQLWTKSYINGAWTSYAPLGGGTIISSPSATSWTNDGTRIDVVARNANNEIEQRYWTPQTGWSAFGSMGGCLSDAPTVSSWGVDRLNIYAIGCSATPGQGPSTLWSRHWNAGWESFANPLGSVEQFGNGVQAATTSDRNIHVVARNTAGQLRYGRYNPSSGRYEPLQTIQNCMIGNPGIVNNGAITSVFYKGCDGTLYVTRRVPIKGTTTVSISNTSEPNGYTKKVDFDNTYRTIKAYDKAGNYDLTEWHPTKDYTLSTTTATGLKSTTIYDQNDLPIENYGQAPKEWFDASRRPLAAYASQVPKTESKYDENITGLNIAWFDAKGDTLFGAPKLYMTNTESPSNRVAYDLQKPITPTTTGATGIGLRGTGKITFPGTGTYTFYGNVSDIKDVYRLYVDGRLLINKPLNSGGLNQAAAFTAVAGKQYDIMIEFIDTNTDSPMSTFLQGPGLPVQASYVEFANLIKPGYNLNTSNKAYDSTTGDVTSSVNYGSNPELGLMQSTVSDVGGLAYTSSATYEAQGVANSLQRQTSKTLPGGNTTTYSYYGASEAIDNPCTTAVDPVSQAGFGRVTTEQDPDGTGSAVSRTKEFVYDKKGRVVASRMNNDPWTCTTFDARGRTTQVVQPTINGRIGRTITTSYSIAGNPLNNSTTDSIVGTSESGIDLLGRSIYGKDIWGNIYTTSYDANGRASSIVSPVGTETYTYDNLDRVTTYAIDSVAQATITYDNFSRVTGITYPQAKDTLGNTLKMTLVKRDALQRVNGSTYQTSDGKVFDESVTLSQLGKTVGASQTYNGQTLASAFSFDKLGRLTSATVGQTKFDYGFSTPNAGCTTLPGYNPTASKDSNRSEFITTNLSTNTQQSYNWFCYDMADRLIKSSDPQIGVPTYDDHGNTSTFAGGTKPITFTYNAADQNTMISQGTNRIEYTKTPSGAIVRKKEYLNGVLSKSYRYISGGRILQSCSLTDDSSCANLDTYITLPGAVSLTKSPTNTDTTKRIVYSLKNFHGDTALTINSSGVATSNLMAYGPFGEGLIAGTLGAFTTGTANSSNQFMGWAANPSRKQESMFTLAIVQMGQRVYIPSLGRFLQADPVSGGTSNAYVYVNDPVNFEDYNGMFGVPKWVRFVAAAVAIVAVVVAVIILAPIIAAGAAISAGVALGIAALGAVAGAGISIAARGKIDATTALHAAIGAASALLLTAGAAIAGSIMSSSSGGVIATGGSACAATDCADKAPKIQGVYQFMDKFGDKYVGISNDIGRRMAEHGDRIQEGTFKILEEMPGASRLALRIAEQNYINGAGGVCNLANKINSVRAVLWPELGIIGAEC